MPRGRLPQGEHALSDAERQARYRARQLAKQVPTLVRYRRTLDRRSRAQRWCDAVADILALQAEYAAWSDGSVQKLVGFGGHRYDWSGDVDLGVVNALGIAIGRDGHAQRGGWRARSGRS